MRLVREKRRENSKKLLGFAVAVLLLGSCAMDPTSLESPVTVVPGLPEVEAVEPQAIPALEQVESEKEPVETVRGEALQADVISVDVSGSPGAYQFSVRVSSPDTGCEQYADWWEVLDETGNLLYRRILTHSHVGEQPFQRSGGPVDVDAGDVVIVRAHMNNLGYGGLAFKGSVPNALVQIELESGFALEIEKADPQPSACGF